MRRRLIDIKRRESEIRGAEKREESTQTEHNLNEAYTEENLKDDVKRAISSYSELDDMSYEEINSMVDELFNELNRGADYIAFLSFLTELIEKTSFRNLNIYGANFYNKSLNENQHNVIEAFCNVRLWMRENLNKIFTVDSKERQHYRNCFNKGGLDSILSLYNLPLFESSVKTCDIPIHVLSEGIQDSSSKIKENYYALMDVLDKDMGKYIEAIDSKFGTTYGDIFKEEN